MLKIKLQPTGKRHQRSYRIVVVEAKTKLSGSVLEVIGTYNPHESDNQKKIVINKTNYQSWVSKGAQPTDTIRNLLK